ncbi:hypothetical protein [Streptomyces sp. NPDC002156]
MCVVAEDRFGLAGVVQQVALQLVQDGWRLGALGVTEVADGVPFQLRPQVLDLAVRSSPPCCPSRRPTTRHWSSQPADLVR